MAEAPFAWAKIRTPLAGDIRRHAGMPGAPLASLVRAGLYLLLAVPPETAREAIAIAGARPGQRVSYSLTDKALEALRD